MATKTATVRSLKVACPECGEAGTITIDLNDLALCTCENCNEEFSPQQAYDRISEAAQRWACVVAWIDNAPIA